MCITPSCSHDLNTHGRIYRYEPSADRVTLLVDLGELTGEAGTKTIPQGKSHCPFFECDGKLYFSTQYGFFQSTGDRERPAGIRTVTSRFPAGISSVRYGERGIEDLVIGAPEEGVIAMQMDAARKRIYWLTWPSGYFLVYDISARRLRNLGKVSQGGEAGDGEDYLCLCRSMGLWPETGDISSRMPTAKSAGIASGGTRGNGCGRPHEARHLRRVGPSQAGPPGV